MTSADPTAPPVAPVPRRRAGKIKAALPFIVAALLFGIGMAALYRLLEPVDLDEVLGQLRAMPWSTVVLALLTTVCAYLSLVGYDWSALRYIGKPLPLPVTLTGGLMAYAFGNTIGLSAIAGGAVRWRVYSGLGLDGYDVAAVSTFAAVSFGVAATVVGLAAVALHPDALAAFVPLAPHQVQWVALGGILAIAGPLIWAGWKQAVLRLGRFELRAPSLGILAGQVVFSLGDLCFTALTLWMLLPVADIGFLPFLAIFAAASVAAVISHVPGGVGIFETIIIAAMPAGTDVGQMAAALLLYRMIYYLLPFALALVVLAIYEIWRGLDHRRPDGAFTRRVGLMEPALRAVAPLTPLVLGVMIFGAGLWMSLATLIPPTGPAAEAAEAAEAFFPRALAEGSVLLTSALGAMLIVVALGVVRRSFGAFVIAASAIAAGAGMALADGEWRRGLALAAAVLILLPFRRAFFRRATLTEAPLAPGWIVLVLSTLTAFAFMLFFANKSTGYGHEMWWQFAADERAPRALRAGFTASLTVVALALIVLVRAPRFRPMAPDARTLAMAEAVAARADDPSAGYALTGDKAIIGSQGGDGFVMFAPAGRFWIALGPPVGGEDAAREAGWRFVEAARQEGAHPVFHDVGPEAQALMLELGMSLHHMGDEAVVGLESRAAPVPEGFRLCLPPHAPARLAEWGRVSDHWLARHGRGEKGFAAGRFDPAWLNRWRVAELRAQGRVIGFATLVTAPEARAVTLDLLRVAPDAPEGTRDVLIAASLAALASEGWQRLSLGAVPVSGMDPARRRRLWDRFGAVIFRHGDDFADSESLRAFKAGFGGRWVPRFMAVPTALSPLGPLSQTAALIGGKTGPAGRSRRIARLLRQ